MNRQVESLKRFLGRGGTDDGHGAPRVLVAGGRASVGTSTVTAGLALGAAAAGLRVVVVDAAGDGGVCRLLGRGDAGAAPGLDRLTLLGVEEDRATDLLGTTRFGGGDAVVLVDAGSRLAAMAAEAPLATRALVVSDTSRVSLSATYAVLKVLRADRPGLHVGALVNRATGPEGEAALGLVNAAAVRFLGRGVERTGALAEDALVMRAVANGRPLQDLRPVPPLLRALEAVAGALFDADGPGAVGGDDAFLALESVG